MTNVIIIIIDSVYICGERQSYTFVSSQMSSWVYHIV